MKNTAPDEVVKTDLNALKQDTFMLSALKLTKE